MNCGLKTIKYALFSFNLIFVLCGIALISLGIVIQSFYREYEILLDDRFFSTPSLLISSGSIIFFIAFFGCCGAVKEIHCMVLTFGVLLGAVFVMELVAGITGFVLSKETHNVLSATLKKSMYNYENLTDHLKTRGLWDTLQVNFLCCGANNYTDWFEVMNETFLLPTSCCSGLYGVIATIDCTYDYPGFYNQPCLMQLSQSISNYAWSLGALATTISFMQIVGIIFACYLAKAIRSPPRYGLV